MISDHLIVTLYACVVLLAAVAAGIAQAVWT
jgi:hypothetical protein